MPCGTWAVTDGAGEQENRKETTLVLLQALQGVGVVKRAEKQW